MARSPRQSIVIPFYKKDTEYLFAVFQRKETSGGFWQWISGGAEGDESPRQTAIRELSEEAGVYDFGQVIELESMCTIPKIYYKEREHWDKAILVVPEYAFAIELNNQKITISDEHQNFKWATYNEAMSTLKWDSNRTALWELVEKLKN